jgi:hypothetical protein
MGSHATCLFFCLSVSVCVCLCVCAAQDLSPLDDSYGSVQGTSGRWQLTSVSQECGKLHCLPCSASKQAQDTTPSTSVHIPSTSPRKPCGAQHPQPQAKDTKHLHQDEEEHKEEHKEGGQAGTAADDSGRGGKRLKRCGEGEADAGATTGSASAAGDGKGFAARLVNPILFLFPP